MISKGTRTLLGFGTSILLLLPLFVYAAPVPIGGGLNSLASAVPKLINILMQIIIILSVGFMIYGATEIIIKGSDQEARKAGRAKLLWGLVTVLIMVSVLGLIAVVRYSFSINHSPTGLINATNFLSGIK